uniref:Uncharacterized protein n=1 Tax=Opuntia streptacantha TaxID=393608 RepID=A0A7C9CYW7_OPUST
MSCCRSCSHWEVTEAALTERLSTLLIFSDSTFDTQLVLSEAIVDDDDNFSASMSSSPLLLGYEPKYVFALCCPSVTKSLHNLSSEVSRVELLCDKWTSPITFLSGI